MQILLLDEQVEKVFANKISGAVRNEERTEICELVDFVKNNQIRRVVCLEISRIGRNTLEALKIIQVLNENVLLFSFLFLLQRYECFFLALKTEN